MANEVRTEAELVRAVVLVVALFLCGCEAKMRVESKPAEASGTDTSVVQTSSGVGIAVALTPAPVCPKEAYLSVLRKLNPMLDIPYEASEQTLKELDGKIACIRDWSETLTDACLKDNYADWLKYYSGRIERARADLRDRGKAESDLERYERERRDEDRRVRAWEAAHNPPKPPSCDIELIRKVKP